MHVLVYGYKGWIGQQVCQLLSEKGHTWIGGQCRVDDVNSVKAELLLSGNKVTHVFCVIGRTHGPGHNTIDYLEGDGKLVDNVRDNLFAPVMLAMLCREKGIHMTYIGTGCIFNSVNELGDLVVGGRYGRGYTENDFPDFFGSSYSIVKGFTDRIMAGIDGCLNLRIRMPITGEVHERNFITKIVGYKKICSIDNSMTVLDALLPIVIDMMDDFETGTYNLVNPGVINHNRILEMYCNIVDNEFTWDNMNLSEQDSILACKRSNNKLDTTKLEKYIIGKYGKNVGEAMIKELEISISVRSALRQYNMSKIKGAVRTVESQLPYVSSRSEKNDVYDNLRLGGAVLKDVCAIGLDDKAMQSIVPFTLNYKPTPGGRKFYRTPVPLHWDNNPVHTVTNTHDVKLCANKMIFANKVILVTGGCGFIGSNFINYMLSKYKDIGLKIVNIDALYYCASEQNVLEWIRNKGDMVYKFIKCNIQQREFVEYIFREEKPDYVIHFAAQSHVDNSFNGDLSMDYTMDNVLGTHVIMECCRRYINVGGGNLVKIIHVSTDEVYGESMMGDGVEKTEQSLLCPTNPYAATKAGAEMIVSSYKHSFGLPVIISRGNNVYGPNQYPEKLIPKWIGLLRDGKKLTIAGKGEQLRSFLWVDDVSRAFETMLVQGTVGEVYNIGSCEEYSVMDVAKIILELIHGGGFDINKYVEYVADRPFNDMRYFINNSKLCALGWKPEMSFIQGLSLLLFSPGVI
jgi:dTDP-glucose 4,6-dehydratase